jgi:hypothetical protein
LIDVNKISTSAIDESLKSFLDTVINTPSKNDFESQQRIYKALMDYSLSLLEKYHAALKAELAKYDIDI